MKFYFLSVSALHRETWNWYHCSQYIINYSPMQLIKRLQTAEDNAHAAPDKKSYYYSFRIDSVLEITEEEYFLYKDDFEN